MRSNKLKYLLLMTPLLLCSCGGGDDSLGEPIKDIKSTTVLQAIGEKAENVLKLKIQTDYNYDPGSGFVLKQKDSKHKLFYNEASKFLVITSTEQLLNLGIEELYYPYLLDLDLSSTSNETSIMSKDAEVRDNALASMPGLVRINLENFNFAKTMTLKHFFDINREKKLKEINIKGVKTETVENMSYMFANTLIDKIYIDYSLGYANNMDYMFSGCENLTTVEFSDKYFNTSRIQSMEGMFEGTKVSKVTNLNTKEVKNMKALFRNATITTTPQLEFDITSVTDMSEMFKNCKFLEELDTKAIFKTKVQNLRKVKSMFEGALALTTVDLDGLPIEKTEEFNYIFKHCVKLGTITITKNFQTNGTFEGMFWNVGNKATSITLNMPWLKGVLSGEAKAKTNSSKFVIVGDNYIKKDDYEYNTNDMTFEVTYTIGHYLVTKE